MHRCMSNMRCLLPRVVILLSDLVFILVKNFENLNQMYVHLLRNLPDTQYLTHTIVLHSTECRCKMLKCVRLPFSVLRELAF